MGPATALAATGAKARLGDSWVGADVEVASSVANGDLLAMTCALSSFALAPLG